MTKATDIIRVIRAYLNVLHAHNTGSIHLDQRQATQDLVHKLYRPTPAELSFIGDKIGRISNTLIANFPNDFRLSSKMDTHKHYTFMMLAFSATFAAPVNDDHVQDLRFINNLESALILCDTYNIPYQAFLYLIEAYRYLIYDVIRIEES